MSEEQQVGWCEGNAMRGWAWVGQGVTGPGRDQITGRPWQLPLFCMHWVFKQDSKLIYVLKDHSCCFHTI